jgi:toxin CcdB
LIDSASLAAAASEVTPIFAVAGRRVTLDPFQIASLPVAALGPRVASLADDVAATAIQRALDELFRRAFG